MLHCGSPLTPQRRHVAGRPYTGASWLARPGRCAWRLEHRRRFV